MNTKDKTSILVANTDIQHVMNGGGIVWQGNTVPGPTTLRGGNLQAGFYGEVPASEFITGNELAKRIGFWAGTSQNSKVGWLKFTYMGKIEFVAKKPFRHSISWDNINNANAVYGSKTINILGKTYKVRLMKGKTEGKQNNKSYEKGDICKGSEWNKLMLPIHKNAPRNWAYNDNVDWPTRDGGVDYTDDDLATKYTGGDGSYCWCQEYGESTDNHLLRGYEGVSYSGCTHSSYSGNPTYGWRPVLELVE